VIMRSVLFLSVLLVLVRTKSILPQDDSASSIKAEEDRLNFLFGKSEKFRAGQVFRTKLKSRTVYDTRFQLTLNDYLIVTQFLTC